MILSRLLLAGATAAVLGLSLGASPEPQQPDPPKLAADVNIPVTARFRNALVSDALELIAHQRGLTVEFAPDLPDLRTARPITAQFEKASLDDVLTTLLSGARLTYEVVNERTIRVVKE